MLLSTESTFDRDRLARWYADRHLRIDDALERIFYLPHGAPPQEIRFLEVNRMIPETPPEPIDFGVDVGSVNAHSLLVLDVTPSQWQAIQAGSLPLPEGWDLEGKEEFYRAPDRP